MEKLRPLEKNSKKVLILSTVLSCIFLGTVFCAPNSKKEVFIQEDKNRRDSIVSFAKSLLGTPYKVSGNSPDGFDCSGFVYYVYSKFNLKISRSSYTIGEDGVDVDSSEAQKADLIFFTGTDPNDPKVGHIGIIISENDEPIEFIHSSSSSKHSGVVITKLDSSPRYRERYVKIKSVL